MMPKKNWLYLIFIAIYLPLLSFEQAESSSNSNLKRLPESQQDLYKKIASGIRCPNCTGLSVLDSDTTFSQQIKNKIITLLEQNNSEQDIFSFFTKRYGLWILRQPPKKGVHLIIWLLPILFLITGPLSIYFFWWYKKNKDLSFKKRQTKEDLIIKQFHHELSLIKKGEKF